MKFYNREEETKELNKFYGLKKKKSIMIVLAGRRRVGKTRLAEEFMQNKESLSFFFPVKEKGLVLDEFSKEIKAKNNYSPSFRSFEEFAEFLFTKDNIIIFFDEFQNVLKVDKGFLYSLQKYWDKQKEQKHIMLVVTGSYIGMMKKIFQNQKAPLFGRADAFFNLKQLDINIISSILDDLGINDFEEKLKIYGILGGIPKYYELLENTNAKAFSNIIKELFFKTGTPLIYEGKNILIEEFGKRYKIYFSILESIANGKNTSIEIANSIFQKPTTITKYLLSLEDYFEIIERIKPVTENKSKKSRYVIKDSFLNFWFKFIHSNYRYIEENKNEVVFEKIMEEFTTFFGRRFESICKEILWKIRKDFLFTKMGSWWGHYRDENNVRKELEIDIVALNEKTKEILFGECKWKNEVNAEKIVKELAEKAKYVDWNRTERRPSGVVQPNRKESYAVFAKSFSKRIKEFEGKPVRCFDLTDLKKLIRKK